MSLWVINKIDKKLVATIWDKLTANTLKASIFSLQTELNYKTNCFPTYKGNANSPNTHILCGCKYNVWQVISQVISLSACFWRDPVPEAKNRLAPAGVWKPATSQGMWGKLWSSRVYRLGVGKQFPGTPYHLPSYPSFSLSTPPFLCSCHTETPPPAPSLKTIYVLSYPRAFVHAVCSIELLSLQLSLRLPSYILCYCPYSHFLFLSFPS